MHFLSAIWILQVIVEVLITISETTVVGPSSPIKAFVGEIVNLTWTSDKKLLVVTWGIRSGSSAVPQYIFVDNTETPNINSALDDELEKRLHYIGNLTAGHAWFAISNATLSDSNTYIALIREDVSGSTSQPYIVQVIVEPKPTAAPMTPSTTNGLAGNCSGVNCTTTPTPTPSATTSAPPADVRGLSEGEIAGISGGLGALLLAVCSVFGICYCCKKGMCEFCGCEIYWCKCCCCECCWCKSCMCVPFLCPKRKDEEDNKTDDN